MARQIAKAVSVTKQLLKGGTIAMNPVQRYKFLLSLIVS